VTRTFVHFTHTLAASMRYTIPTVIMLSGCVAGGGPPDHPLTATWQGAKTLELSATGYRFGDEFGAWSVEKQTLRLVRDTGGEPARKGEERCSYSLNGRILIVSDCRFAGRYVRAG
jgi:hypothetical protein